MILGTKILILNKILWGFWIKAQTLETAKFNKQSNFPKDALIVKKLREYDDETDRFFINTTYHLFKDGKIHRVFKKDFSLVIRDAALKIIEETNEWPPSTDTYKIYKNGNRDLIYKPTDYDKFFLKLSPKLMADNHGFFG